MDVIITTKTPEIANAVKKLVEDSFKDVECSISANEEIEDTGIDIND